MYQNLKEKEKEKDVFKMTNNYTHTPLTHIQTHSKKEDFLIQKKSYLKQLEMIDYYNEKTKGKLYLFICETI